jgi:hypothetical protein
METHSPHPSHLDQRDPARPKDADIREDADLEIAAYEDLADLVLLMPEDRWDEFLRLTGVEDRAGEALYRGVTFRKAAVTDVVVQEGF